MENREQIEKTNHLNRAGLNWEVREEGIKSINSDILIPKSKVIIREDNNIPLGIHGEGYHPYQNHELLELLYKISNKTGLDYHSGGFFGNGEKVWFQLKGDDLRIGTDKVEGFISGFNSFDGSTSLAFGNANLTVSCQNSFWMGLKEVQTKVRHSSNMEIRIDLILKRIDQLVEEEKETFRKIKRMTEVEMDEKVKELVIQKLFDIKFEDKLDDLSTYKQNRINEFKLDLDREISDKGENMWGLFSGVTRYTTHSMKKGDNTVSKIFGMAGKRERAIWDELIEVIQ